MKRLRDMKRTVTFELPESLMREAERFGLDFSAACERGLRAEIEKLWIAENLPAIEAWNKWVEERGLPLEQYRQF